jgi:ABC-type transport system substrate-binding protein
LTAIQSADQRSIGVLEKKKVFTMKKYVRSTVVFLCICIVLASCGPSQAHLDAQATSIVAGVFETLTAEAPTIAPSLIETQLPTLTSTPASTPTATLTSTPLPGRMTFPIQALSDSIPWLAWDENFISGILYLGFGLTNPPFDVALVRKAFAAAIDREAIGDLAERLHWNDVRPATTFIHPEVLGRDLYNDVGIPFDPEQARDYLAQAGYTDPSSFPSTTFVISEAGQPAPGFYYQMAGLIVEMWKEHLGVTVKIEDLGRLVDYYQYLYTSNPELFRLSFVMTTTDGNDPDTVFRYAFYTQLNVSDFSNADFDNLIDQASSIADPLQRQILYVQAERLLCEEFAVVIPLFHYAK